MCVCVWLCTHVRAGTHRDQKTGSDLLELELQAIVTCLTWVLGTEVRSSPRAVRAPNCWPSLQLWIESLSNGCTLNATPDSRYANTAAQGEGPPLTTASYFVLSLAQDPPAPVAGVTRTSECATTASGLWNKHPVFFPGRGILLSVCHSVCV